jgi:hypothetical protein
MTKHKLQPKYFYRFRSKKEDHSVFSHLWPRPDEIKTFLLKSQVSLISWSVLHPSTLLPESNICDQLCGAFAGLRDTVKLLYYIDFIRR